MVKIGVENPDAVSLVLAPDVPEDVLATVEDLRQKIASGEIEVSVEFDGEEFQP